ncbi:MAG TPA: SDR family oxidoreductase [Acidothermaceae bacterium]|nr:SDR family oxidoreductase [Acidothermaceae bacterium]
MTTALVTGATSGIGAGFAERYARLGYHLVLVARDEQRLRTKADELHDRWHVEVEVLPADLSSDDECARVEARLLDDTRPIGVLVNNAGYSLGVDVVESDVEAEDRMLRVLTRAPLRLTKAALPGMLARNRGTIITVSSVAGIISYNSYGAAKAWALKFSQAVSLRLANTDVRAIALCPGLVHTEFHERSGVDASAAPRFMWLTVDRVVDECLRDLAKGKAISVPSRRYRVLVGVGARLPSNFTARIARNRGVRSRRG